MWLPASCHVLAGGHILTFLIPYIRTWAKDIEVRTVPFSSFLNRDKRQLSRCLICPRAIISSPLFCFVFKLFPTGSMHSTGTTIFSRRGNLGEVKIRGQSSVIYDESGWLKRHGLSNEPMRPGRGMWWCVKQKQIRDLHLHSTTPCPLQEATFLWLAMELEDASACTSQSARHMFRMDMRGISIMDHQI